LVGSDLDLTPAPWVTTVWLAGRARLSIIGQSHMPIVSFPNLSSRKTWLRARLELSRGWGDWTMELIEWRACTRQGRGWRLLGGQKDQTTPGTRTLACARILPCSAFLQRMGKNPDHIFSNPLNILFLGARRERESLTLTRAPSDSSRAPTSLVRKPHVNL
jgi:hypothetical protein